MMTDSKLKLLAFAKNFIPENLKLSCGPTAVELCLFAANKISELSGQPLKVASTFLWFSMLPTDVEKSLRALSFKQARVRQIETDQVAYLKKRVDEDKCTVIFFDTAIGHWITVWGYDENNFYCYDTSKKAVRDEPGLTSYTHEHVLRKWQSRPWIIKMLSALSPIWPRLRTEPFTTVEW